MGLILSTMAVLSKSLATVTGASLLLLALASPRSQRARLYLNALLYVGGLGVCSVWGVLVSIVLSLVPGQRLNINKVVARSFYYLTGTLTGIRFEVEGEEHFSNKSPAVLVGNHQTGIDILYLGRIFPGFASIMAKQELKFAPLLGQYMLLSGAVFINRKNRHDSIKAFAQVGADMKRKNLSLWVFPEGTRSNLPFPDLLPFKKGAFHLAVQSGVPIIPVVCEHYHRLFDGKTRFESGTIKIKVLPPIATSHLTADDVTDLTNSVRQKMLDELKAMDAQRQQHDVAATIAGADAAQQQMPAPRLGGIAGLMAKLVGTGSPQRKTEKLQNKLEKQEQQLRKPGTSGTKADDYGLVTEAQKQKQQQGADASTAATASAVRSDEADEIRRRNAAATGGGGSSTEGNGSGSSVGETDDDGNVVISRPTSIS